MRDVRRDKSVDRATTSTTSATDPRDQRRVARARCRGVSRAAAGAPRHDGLVERRRVSRRPAGLRVPVVRRQVALACRIAARRSGVDPRADRARGQAVLLAPRRRSDRGGAGGVVRRDPRAARLGRLDAVDAAGEALRATRAHAAEQARGHVSRGAARSAAVQARDPRRISVAHAVRRQRRGRRERRVDLFRPRPAAPDAARDRDAVGGAARSCALRAIGRERGASACAVRSSPS
jgi:hypothetical protein